MDYRIAEMQLREKECHKNSSQLSIVSFGSHVREIYPNFKGKVLFNFLFYFQHTSLCVFIGG